MTQGHCVGVIGAGAMGRGIAQLLALAGVEVLLYDANSATLQQATAFITDMLNRQVSKGKLAEADAQAAVARISPLPIKHLSRCSECTIVVEAIVEQMAAKKALFSQLEGIVSPDCILASNTSSLSITELAAECEHPARVAGWHFFNPVPLMRLVEVISGIKTAATTIKTLQNLTEKTGHVAVLVDDMPGFLVNHVGRGFGGEALHILAENVANVDVIDRVMTQQCGFKMGPFELFDLTGLDVSHAVTESIYNQFYYDPRYRPSVIAERRVQAGLLGRKTGEGFYQYEAGKMLNPAKAMNPPADSSLAVPVWIGPGETPHRQWAQDMLVRGGATVEAGETPSSDALIIALPLGQDATSYAAQHQLDAKRTIALDALGEAQSMVVLMPTQVTEKTYRNHAAYLCGQAGSEIALIGDSAGFIAQRILATLINIAAEVAQRGIASVQDINHAVTLGLGYPRGILAWADELGASYVLQVLNNLYHQTGDPRYRPNQWLVRRVMSGAALGEE